MSDNVLSFPYASQPIQPVAQFIRLGESAYSKLGNLFAAGGLPARRIVVDASKIRFQKEVIKAFKAEGAEIVLDTKAAELAALKTFAGNPKGAPWSELNDGKPIGPQFFLANRSDDIYGQIARCAVEYGIDVVLAPGHFIGDKMFGEWFDVDRQACIRLRQALDREGGAEIAIDHLLIVPHVQLNDDARKTVIIDGLKDLPFDNLWVRASGFGNDAGPLAVCRYIGALADLARLGRPLVSDYLGGIVGEAALAFGVASGISHGIAERERFSASGWEKLPKKQEGPGGGRAKRINLAGLNKSLLMKEFEVLTSARGSKQMLAAERSRFPGGVRDMANDPQRYAAYEALRHVEALAAVPDLHRGQHFLDGRMTQAVRLGRQVKQLKPSAEKAQEHDVDLDGLMRRLGEHSIKLEKLHSALEHKHEALQEREGRALPVVRANQSPRSGRGQP